VEKRRPVYLDLQKNGYFGKWYPIWVAHDSINQPLIMARFKKEDCCISSIPQTDTPIIAVGSGYSVDRAIPFLKKWKGEIITGNSNVYSLLNNDIVPDYVCAYDAHPSVADHLTKYKQWPKSITLLTHPHIHPRLIRRWKGPVKFFRRCWPGLEYFEWILMLRYSELLCAHGGINIGMRFRGCVLNNEIQCAHLMGVPGRPIYLIGADFGWRPGAKNRCTSYYPKGDGKTFRRVESTPLSATGEDKKQLTIDRNGWQFVNDMDMFKRHMYEMLLTAPRSPYGPLTLIDCSEGSLEELQQASIEEVVSTDGKIKRRDAEQDVRGYLDWHTGILAERYATIQRRHDAEGETSGTGIIGDGTCLADNSPGMDGGDTGGDTCDAGPGPGD